MKLLNIIIENQTDILNLLKKINNYNIYLIYNGSNISWWKKKKKT